MAESDQSGDQSVIKDDVTNKDSAVTQYVVRSAILDGVFFTVVYADKDGVKIVCTVIPLLRSVHSVQRSSAIISSSRETV